MNVTPIYLTWLNYLGGFDYFIFLAEKEFQLEVTETQTNSKNIFPTWPKSYGETATTIERKTFTDAYDKIVVTTQHLTPNQRDVLKYLKVSPVVQIVTSRRDRIEVIVDSDSFKVYDEAQDLFTMTFTLRKTNKIPAQKL